MRAEWCSQPGRQPISEGLAAVITPFTCRPSLPLPPAGEGQVGMSGEWKIEWWLLEEEAGDRGMVVVVGKTTERYGGGGGGGED